MKSTQPLALVTGASSGIGKVLALALANAGYCVYGTSRHPDSIQSPIIPLAFDAASTASINQFVQDNAQLLSNLSLLVNNCGSSLYGDVAKFPGQSLSNQVQLLLEAPILLTRAVLPGMRERGNGSIVNVSSLAGIFPLPFMSVYSGSKAGLSAFTQSLILTEQHRGIVLIDFQPGDYRTAFNKSMQQAENLTEQEAQTWNILEKNCLNGPAAEGAARDILRAIRRGSSGVVRSGTFFHRTMAPFARRLVSARMMRRIMRILYKIRE